MLNNLDFTDHELNKVPYLLTLTLEKILFGEKVGVQEFEQLIISHLYLEKAYFDQSFFKICFFF